MTDSTNGTTFESTYDPSFFAKLFAVEDRHFWFRARNRTIVTVVSQVVSQLRPGFRVLEVGCGTGNVLRVLEEACKLGTVVGMDSEAEALRFARRRTSCELVEEDLRHASFETPFDIVGMFDVLEHLPDDGEVLRNLRSLLSDDGTLLVTVPAHPSLWSYFDVASHHQRRYTLSQLAATLSGAGYRVEFITHYMAGLFPLMWLTRRVVHAERFTRASRRNSYDLATRDLRIVPFMNSALDKLLVPEVWLVKNRRSLPFGPSLLAIAHK